MRADRLRAILTCGMVAVLTATAPAQEAALREPVVLEPVLNEPPPGNGGLFIGVNEFRDKRFNPLDYAVNDAVALAYVMVVELKLIPPGNCYLCLSGQVTKNRESTLQALRQRGVHLVESATQFEILSALGKLREIPDSSLLAVSVSSHGFVQGGVPYVVPSDGLQDRLDKTAVELTTIEAELEQTKARHRLLLIDACQERISGKAIGQPPSSMSEIFARELAKPTGQIKIASCKPGEFSFEDHVNEQGVFTAAFLSALRGEATPRADNIVDLDAVLKAVDVALLKRRKSERQSLSLSGVHAARSMPLAVRAPDSKQLQARLKSRISESGFSQELFDQLTGLLPKLKPTNPADQELLEATRDFAAGRMKEFAYLPLLRERLKPQAAKPMPVVTRTGESEPKLPKNRPSASGGRTVVRNSLGMDLVLIPAGSFLRGSPDSDKDARDDEKPQRQIEITQPFRMGRCEVTKGQFAKFVAATKYVTEAERDGEGGWGFDAKTRRFVGRDPHFNWAHTGWTPFAEDHPVVNVTWNDAIAMCNWLSTKEKLTPCYLVDGATVTSIAGTGYRLPTEAEWEYVCRAGATTVFANGNDPKSIVRCGNILDQSAQRMFLAENSVSASDGCAFTAAVGKYAPNAFGVCDMHGNVWEWCNDWYSEGFLRLSPPQDPFNMEAGSHRTVRGGSWFNPAFMCRAANRLKLLPDYRDSRVGFRLVRQADR